MRGRALVVAIVEYADHANVAVDLSLQRIDQRFARCAAADDDGAAGEPAVAHPLLDQHVKPGARGEQNHQADGPEAEQPDARQRQIELEEKRHRDRKQEHHRPGGDHARHLIQRAAECVDLIDIDRLERDHRYRRDSGDGEDIGPAETLGREHIDIIDEGADERDQHGLEGAHEARDDDRRDRRAGCDRCCRQRCRRQLSFGTRGHIRDAGCGSRSSRRAQHFVSVQFEHLRRPSTRHTRNVVGARTLF